ncbi:MAG TPA: aminotransferase class IV [Acidimicrobiia bacterium]|nr:aminotransferase class IV [Acidimicrobiia bacterium]
MMLALIDGDPTQQALSVFDGAVLRGDGCFEAIRSYRGRPFAFEEHYARLTRSAAALRLEVPPAQLLESWVEACARDGGDCIVRVVVTRGGSVPGAEDPSRCVVLGHSLPMVNSPLHLLPVAAPWHPGGEDWELAGVKSISYAANQAASRQAHEAGADDALLFSREGHVLEGPTFSVAWVIDGAVETPALDLGILESITRGFVIDDCRRLGIPIREGRFPLQRLLAATEVMALSTVKEVARVGRVGTEPYPGGEVTGRLQAAFAERVQETAAEQASTGS